MEGSITNNTVSLAQKYGVPENFVKHKILEARSTGAFKAFMREADIAKSERNFVKMSDVAYRAGKFEYDYVLGEIEKIQNEQHTVSELLSTMTEEDGYKADCAIHRLIFALDYVESCAIDLVECLKKFYPDICIKNFDTLFKLKDEARAVMRDIHSRTTNFGAYLFADIADEIVEFVDVKVKEYLNKIKEHQNETADEVQA